MRVTSQLARRSGLRFSLWYSYGSQGSQRVGSQRSQMSERVGKHRLREVRNGKSG